MLFDAVTLFKDAGADIYELSKTLLVKMKSMIVTVDADKTEDGETVNDNAKTD